MRNFDYPLSEAAERLLRSLRSNKPNQEAQLEDARLLSQFRDLFPPEKLRSLGLHDYCLGDDNKESFCNWIEKKLGKLGKYAVGSSRSHFIFKQQKDGQYYVVKEYSELPVEEALSAVLEFHARAVELGSSDTPEGVESMSLDWLGHGVKLFPPEKLPSRVLKILHSYYPDRFFPINSPPHLDCFLEGLGVPKAELPQGFVRKNLLLQSFSDKYAAPIGFSSLELMRALYASDLAPFSIDIKKRDTLEGAVRFFRMYYGEEGFLSASYLEDERNYKIALRERWLQVSSSLAAAQGEPALAEAGRSIAKFLQPSKDQNLLNWRYTANLKGLDDASLGKLARATKELLFSSGENPDVEAFNRVLFSLGNQPVGESAESRPASRSIPTLLLWLENPEEEFYLRSDSLSSFTRVVTGRDCVRQGILTNRDYMEWRRFAICLKDELSNAGLGPKDLIDIQGFIWRVTMSSFLWFGGCSFGGTENQLARFRTEGIWSWSLGEDWSDELGEWIHAHPDLGGWDGPNSAVNEGKKAFKTQFAAFADLAKNGGPILAKRAYYDRSSAQSRLGIDALGYVEPASLVAVQKDELIIPVTWLREASLVLDNTQFGKVAKTMQELDLATALSILGQAEKTMIPVPPVDLVLNPIMAQKVRQELVAPPNLILYGPPGTGKTYKLRNEYMPRFSGSRERYSFVTFHQNYSYEDFVEGLRPVVDATKDGKRDFELRPGLFKQACLEALRLSGFEGSIHEFCTLSGEQRKSQYAGGAVPGYALFIDEINRGNISKLFGELITLVEDDKRLTSDNELIVTLPNSQERFGVPPNLHLIGSMNTADRSIALLDTALRRRFEFIELLPDYVWLEGLPGLAWDLDLASMLRAINERIEFLYDREHQVGHGYFKGLEAPGLDPEARFKALGRIFRASILPLLAEYFFDDWERISLVLGDDRKDASHRFLEHHEVGQWVDADSEIVAARGGSGIWRIREDSFADPEAYRGIYKR